MADREAYEQKIDAQMREWQANLDAMKAKADQATADAKIEYESQLNQASDAMKEARTQLDALKSVSADKWQVMRDKVDQATRDVGVKLNELKTRFSM
jgi:hypothetical protein